MKHLLCMLLYCTTAVASGQSWVYCGNTKRLSLKEIKTLFPYNQTGSIKVISFKRQPTGEFKIPKNNGKVDFDQAFEVRSLNDSLTNQLLDVLVNFNYDFSSKNKVDASGAFCYDPRNAIVFIDKNSKTIGYLELCFECKGNEIEPKNMTIGEFCVEKYEIIKTIFSRAGIRYGVAYIEEMAAYPGGVEAMLEYLEVNRKYSECEGRVLVEFVVNEDGSLSDFRVLKGVSESCDSNALQLIKRMPKWIPATSDEKPIKSKMVVPVMYHL